MRTANNIFTVENLVAKYRNYVSKNCPKFQDFDGYQEFLMSTDDNAEGQLLITLYSAVAGEKADPKVEAVLANYAKQYLRYAKALSKDEFSFLCEHFSEVVTLCSKNFVNLAGAMCPAQLSGREIELVKEYIHPEPGSTVFIANSGIGEIATLFPNCHIKGFASVYGGKIDGSEIWAIGQIRLYAQGIESNILLEPQDCTDPSYLSDVEYVVWDNDDLLFAADIYRGVKQNCKMIWMIDKSDATYEDKTYRASWNSTYKTLKCKEKRELLDGMPSTREREIMKSVVNDKAIQSIISYEVPNRFNKDVMKEKILFLIEKSLHDKVRIVNVHTGNNFEIPACSLDSELLWPGYYEAIKPKNGKPLSELVSLYTFPHRIGELVRIEEGNDISWALPEEVKKKPLMGPYLMSEEYEDANLLSKDDIMLAGDPVLKDFQAWIRSVNNPCVLLSGKKSNKKDYVVGYVTEIPKSGLAAVDDLVCLVPKEGIDVRYVAALLLTPEVKDQIISVYGNDINNRMFPHAFEKIIIPAHDEKDRWAFLAEANYEAMVSVQSKLKQETEHFKKSVRMRKHALTQSLSSVEAMFYALNTYRKRQNGTISDDGIISRVKGTTVQEAFDFISNNLEDLMPALEHIADVEYSFEEPKWIDPELFVEEYTANKSQGWLNFKPVLTWEKGHNRSEKEIKHSESQEVILKKGDSINKFSFPKDALEKIMNNIISNAQYHGFTDDSRSDYMIRFSWYIYGASIIIEIENNGTPIPLDRDTESLLEYGVSTALHQDGHNGIGCNEIDYIMRQYGGSVKIVSSPSSDFTVKYILTFNHTILPVLDEPDLEIFDDEPELEALDDEPELEVFDDEPELEALDDEPELKEIKKLGLE